VLSGRCQIDRKGVSLNINSSDSLKITDHFSYSVACIPVPKDPSHIISMRKLRLPALNVRANNKRSLRMLFSGGCLLSGTYFSGDIFLIRIPSRYTIRTIKVPKLRNSRIRDAVNGYANIIQSRWNFPMPVRKSVECSCIGSLCILPSQRSGPVHIHQLGVCSVLFLFCCPTKKARMSTPMQR